MSSWRDVVGGILAVVSWFVPWVTPIAMAFNAWSSKENQRISGNRARDAYNASLNDRMILIRSSSAPRNIVLGEDKTSGVVAFVGNSGANSEYLHVVVALAGHQCQSIGEVWLNDQPVGTLDGSNDVTGGAFFVSKGDLAASITTTTSGAPSGTTFTLPLSGGVGVVAGSVSITQGVPGVSHTSPLTSPTHYSVSGNVITWTGAAPAASLVYIHYRLSASLKLVNLRRYLGTTSQAADSTLNTAFPSQWTSTHQGKGITYIALRLQYDENAFPTGVPNITAQVKGALVFDPRTSTTAWSDNPALLARHYLTLSSSLGGFGCSSGEIDDATVIAAANICDELINFAAVTTGKRYLCGCTLSTGAERRQNLQIILDSMAGGASYVQGVWKIYAGAYITPTVTLTESDVIDTIDPTISPSLPTDQTFNVVSGTFVDPTKYWQETEFPRVTNSTYLSNDNGIEHLNSIKLPAVRDPLRAQMIAKQFMDRSRLGLTFQAAFNLKAYKLAPFDTVQLTIARYGWSNKVFEVQERKFSMLGGCQLVLREINSGVYSWSYTSALTYTAAPSTTLPNPFTVATMGTITCASGTAQLSMLGDGTILSRISATWSVSTDSAVLVNGKTIVEWWRHDQSAAQAMRIELAGSAVGAMLGPVDDGEIYVVRACWRNGLGVQGQWNYVNHTVVGKTAVPADPTALTLAVQADGMRRFTITLPANVGDDIAAVVLRYQSGASGVWASMTQLVPPLAVTPQQGGTTVIIETRDPAAGTWSFGAKLVDTSGNYSTGTIFLVNQTLVAALVSAGGISATPGGGNLIANASFDAYTGTSGIADGWAATGIATGVVNICGPTLPFHGLNSQANTATWAAGQWQGFAANVQGITAGQTYTASVYVRVEVSGMKPGITINWHNSAGTFLSPTAYNEATDAAFTASNGTVNYYRLSVTGQAPANATQCYVIAAVANTTAGTIVSGTRFDAAMLQVGDLVTGFAPKEQEYLPGTVGAPALNAGLGGANFVQNSGPTLGSVSNWVFGSITTTPAPLPIANGFSPWFPIGGASLYATVGGTPTSGQFWDMVSSPVAGSFMYPVKVGQRYEFSAYISAHRTTSLVAVAWYNAAGTNLSIDQGTQIYNNQAGNDLINWFRSTLFATAPAGAATCAVFVRAISDGTANPYCFFARVYAGECTANQTTPSPWSPAGQANQLPTDGILPNAATDIVTTSVGSTTVTQAAQVPTQNRQTFASITYTPAVNCTANLTCILTYVLGATAGELHLGLFSSHTTGSVSEFVDFTPSGANTHYNAATLTRQLTLTAGVPVTWYLDGYMFTVAATDAIVTSAFMRIEAIKR